MTSTLEPRQEGSDFLMEMGHLFRDALDALSAHVAILDETGIIHYVNRAWRNFAEANPPVALNVNEGANYLEVCEMARGPDSAQAREMADDIRALLRGEREDITLEYPCHSPSEKRWFIAHVTSFSDHGGKTWLLIVHENITIYKLIEQSIQEREQQILALYAVSRRHEQERALLDRVRIALADELELDIILLKVVSAIAETFGYALVSLYLLHEEKLILQQQVGYETVIPEVSVSNGILGRVVRSGHPILIEDVHTDPDFLAAVPGVVSEVCVPLFADGKVIGVLNVESLLGVRLTTADLALMTALSDTISVAIERARLYTRVHEEEERYRDFIEYASQAIYLYHDKTRRIYYANPAFLNLLGYSLEEAKTLSLYDFVAHEQCEINQIYESLLVNGSTVIGERKWRCKDGRLVDVYVTVSTVHQAGHIYFFVQGQDITERKRAEDALRESESKSRSMIDESADGIILTDEDGRVIEFNAASEKITGLLRESVMGQFVWDLQFMIMPQSLLANGYYQNIKNETQKALKTGQAPFFNRIIETAYERADGTRRFIQMRAFSIRTEKGWRTGNISRDVTEQKNTERALLESEAELRALFASMQDTVLVINRDGVYRKIAPTHPGRFYIPPDAIIGKHLTDLFPAEQVKKFLQVIRQVLETGQTLQIEYPIEVGAETPWFNAFVSPMDEDSTLWVARDITERRQKEEDLLRANQALASTHADLQKMFEFEQVLARTDGLTGLYNRRHFFEMAMHEFGAAIRYNCPLTIILFDVDGFKRANDTFGHAMGDTILAQIAQRAASQVRDVDTLARYGGDEFIVLLPQTTIQAAYHVAERIRERVCMLEVDSARGPLTVTISVGVADLIHDPQDLSVEDVIRRADQALYTAKAKGNNCTVTCYLEK